MLYETMEKLSKFCNNSDIQTFKDIFGDRTGLHLWDKFVANHFDLIYFWQHLDSKNRIKLIETIRREI